MGGLVEDQIRRVMRALIERDSELAQDVIDRDRQVNAYDVEIDEKCVELLALHQPTAGDLRFITTAMKIVTDLERIGDQAVNIAQRTIELNPEPQLKPYVDLPRMAEKAQRMVKESLDAFVSRDTELARRVCGEDADVRSGDLRFITTAMKIVTDLERIGDQAVNIAQRTIELNPEPQLKPYVDLPRMAEKAQRMVKESLDAFVSRDTELARRVCGEDADV